MRTDVNRFMCDLALSQSPDERDRLARYIEICLETQDACAEAQDAFAREFGAREVDHADLIAHEKCETAWGTWVRRAAARFGSVWETVRSFAENCGWK
mgnify:CR=1 FL=1